MPPPATHHNPIEGGNFNEEDTHSPGGTVTALALSIMITPAATAGPHGCYTYSAQDGHAIGSYCPYSAPTSYHQGWGRFWFESGYSANRYTPIKGSGVWAESGYHYGGHLTSHWQKRW